MTIRTRLMALAGLGAVVVSLVATAAAQAATGVAFAPSAFCQSNNTTLGLSGQAGAQTGYSSQYISARFAVQRKETGAVTYTQWETKLVRYGSPQSFGPDLVVMPGHYWVWVQYAWWNGRAWTDINGVVRDASTNPWYSPAPQNYHYFDYSLGFGMEVPTNGNCPVATTS